jgi:GNAT superfamily N-acetyltransferase
MHPAVAKALINMAALRMRLSILAHTNTLFKWTLYNDPVLLHPHGCEMEKPLVRFAEHRDLDGILKLYKELRPHDPALAADEASAVWRELLAQPHMRVIVAEAQGCLASTCMIALVKNLASAGRPFGVIEHVVTLPQFRGRGLARATMQHALDFAWSQNCCKVMLLSGVQRHDAHRLYESLGFRGDIERGFVIKS